MDSAVKLIEALSKLFGSLAWPLTVAVVVLVVLGRHREAVDKAIDRVEKIVAPGGVEIALGEVIKEQEQQLIEKAVEVAESAPEDRDAAVETLVDEARRHDELRALLSVIQDRNQPKARRQRMLEIFNEKTGQLRIMRQGDWIGVTTIEDYDKPRKG